MKIAVIGTGMMGERMAGRLTDAGHDLAVYNRTKERTRALAERGARVGDTPRDAAAGSEIVVSMLSDPAAVRATALGDDGFLAGIGEGGLWIDMSTLSPADSRELAGEAAKAGVRMLDAPVSGSLGAAERGLLVILVGGAAEDVARAKPVFDVLGRAAVHLGPHGAGSAAKLGVNAFLCATMVAAVEGVRVAEAEGLDRDQLQAALFRTEIMPNWALGKLAKLAAGDLSPAFALALAEKDLRLAGQTAQAHGVELPLLRHVHELYRSALDAGLGERDFAAVAMVPEEAWDG